jgi:hypothetical protein
MKNLPLRYLPPGIVKDLLSDYRHQGGLAGYKTFLVEWHARWESVLRFRTVSTHMRSALLQVEERKARRGGHDAIKQCVQMPVVLDVYMRFT